VDSLAALARERVVMTTIADRIVAASAGRSLRVVIGATCPDESGFADHLTRALHARGRPCLCVRSTPSPIPDGHPAPGRLTAPIVAVITSMAAGPDQTPPCQVDIRLNCATAPAPSSGQAVDSDSAALRPGVTGDGQADIIVDTGPAGPVIRHIQPAMTSPPVS
jgi:hypothetical protein